MIILLLILLVLSALFSSSETAFACVNKIRLRHSADQGDKRAARALKIAERVGAQHTWLTHLSHQLPRHDELKAELPYNISPAYDGLVIE